MATAWEYAAIHLYFGPGTPGRIAGYSLEDQAAAAWIDKLNAKGKDGWELLSEHLTSGGTLTTNSWVRYRGTMKRPA